MSAIQVAAYKKFILISLIDQGCLKALPKYTAQGVEKICKAQSPAYFKLFKAFDDTNLQLFNDIASSSSGVFESVCKKRKIDSCKTYLNPFFVGQTYWINQTMLSIPST